MKFVGSIVIALLALSGCASLQSNPSQPFVKVIEASGTKDALYLKTMEWMTRTFRSAKAVIEYQDKEAGLVTGNCSIDLSDVSTVLLGSDRRVDAVIKVEVKEGKTRITFLNAVVKVTSGSGLYASSFSQDLQSGSELEAMFQKKLTEISEGYRKFLNTSGTDF